MDLSVYISLCAVLAAGGLFYYTSTANQTDKSESMSTPKPSESLATFTNRTIEPDKGRTIGFAEYGAISPHARILFFFHGLPGSRIIPVPGLKELCEKKDIYLIALDRPGIGLTSPTADDVSTFDITPLDIMKVLQELDLDIKTIKIGVIGYSMGGPQALKFTQTHPNLIDHLHLIAPASFYAHSNDYKRSPEWKTFYRTHSKSSSHPMNFANRIANMLVRWTPGPVQKSSPLVAPSSVDEESYLKGVIDSTSEGDKAALTPQDRELWQFTTSETFRQGTQGMLKAGLETSGQESPSGWGWDVTEFRKIIRGAEIGEGVETHFHAAKTDCLMPLDGVVNLADLIGARTENFKIYDSEIGHLALLKEALGNILEIEGTQ